MKDYWSIRSKKYDIIIGDIMSAMLCTDHRYYSSKNCLKLLFDTGLVLDKYKETMVINTIAL